MFEAFNEPPPLGEGDLSHFASGYRGWRYNVEPFAGKWTCRESAFCGVEIPGHNHPATASYGFEFSNIHLSCELRLDSVNQTPLPWHTFLIRLTDANGYIASFCLHPEGGMLDFSEKQPQGGYRSHPLDAFSRTVARDVWHPLELRVSGPQIEVTAMGHELKGEHPAIDCAKTSILFGAQTAASIRRLKIWDA